MVSPESVAPLAAEELAELLGIEAAQALARPRRGRTRKVATPVAASVAAKSPQWQSLAELAGCVVRVSRPGQGEVQGRLSQRDGQWGLWLE
jgi:hypothetical protein